MLGKAIPTFSWAHCILWPALVWTHCVSSLKPSQTATVWTTSKSLKKRLNNRVPAPATGRRLDDNETSDIIHKDVNLLCRLFYRFIVAISEETNCFHGVECDKATKCKTEERERWLIYPQDRIHSLMWTAASVDVVISSSSVHLNKNMKNIQMSGCVCVQTAQGLKIQKKCQND